MCSFLAKDFCMFMVVSWDDLVPGSYGLVGSLFSELLHNGGLCGASRIDFHDAEIQLLSGFKEGSVLDHGSHTRNLYCTERIGFPDATPLVWMIMEAGSVPIVQSGCVFIAANHG